MILVFVEVDRNTKNVVGKMTNPNHFLKDIFSSRIEKKPNFFCIEGVDGSGKTTQIQLLHQRLQKEGYPTCIIREPGGCHTSEVIRDLLLDKKAKISDFTELLLFMASRHQLIEEILLEELSKNQIVLADRFIWSTIAYQIYGRQLELEPIIPLIQKICSLAYPTYTFLLDLPSTQISERLDSTINDRIESQKENFFKQVVYGYQSLAKKRLQDSISIPAQHSQENISQQIWKIVLKSPYIKKTR